MESTDLSEDLEYHITFPSPLSKDVPEDEDEGRQSIDYVAQEPVVILLGWGGCQDKHLSKYSCIYEKRCITIRYTAPTQDIFYSSGNLKTIAAKLLDLLEELSLVDNPVFIHLFSNGGGMVYRHMSELIHSDPKYGTIRFRGIILDSCPSQRKVSVAVKALMSSLKVNIVLRYLLAFLFGILCILKDLLRFLFEILGLKKGGDQDYFIAMFEDPNRCPQLYLYSKADEIVSSHGIDEYIQHRMKLGVKCDSVCWDTSPHVQHFRHHREAYIQNCLSFLDSCLETEMALGGE